MTLQRIVRALPFAILLLIPISLTGAAPRSPDGLPGRAAPGSVQAPSPTPQGEEIRELVEAAVLSAVQAEENVLAYIIFDVRVTDIEISADGQAARAWLEFYDRDSRAPIPTEPGLAIALLVDEIWQVSLPSQAGWPAALQALPEDLLGAAAKSSWLDRHQGRIETQDDEPYDGFLLPWPEDEVKFLTRSISHGIGGPMHYAFDFAEPGYPSDMFAVYAAKGGTVKWAEWTYPNGFSDSNCNLANYLVIEHTDTTPPTYSMYLHLAHESIPVDLRDPAASVHQGQFIGVADDTGCSSGNHLHFQVHTNPWSYWGSSVDVIFNDVAINGGRPRTVAEAMAYPAYGAEGQDLYTSGNPVWNENDPPTGQITSPATGATLQDGQPTITGWAHDAGSGLSHYQLKARFNESWQPVGPVHFAPVFNQSWDWCAAGVPDGPVALALDVWDRQGNFASLAGIRHVLKDFTCPQPPPVCQPGPGQVALYAEPGYDGECRVLDTGGYANGSALLPAGMPNSARVGAGASLTLFSQEDFSGRAETLLQNDWSLLDNPIGADRARSALVSASSQLPASPNPRWPAPGQTISQTATLDLVWADAGGGLEYQARLTGTAALTSPWGTTTAWNPAGLNVGVYQWQIRARNGAGIGAWSTPRALTIAPATLPVGTTQSPPWSESFESGPGEWEATGGWAISTEPDLVHEGAQSFHMPLAGSGDEPRAGDLTSPPISIDQDDLGLRFWYRYQTEGPGPYWDQRWLQLSVDGGPFENHLQFEDDPSDHWLQSPMVDLSAFHGSTLRLRFHFGSLDEEDNDGQGWAIDELEITSAGPLVCPDGYEPNPDPSQATPIDYDTPISASICPAGDRDHYVFQGSAGDRIAVDVDAEMLGSSLDAHLFLLDTDGRTVLAENDDEILYTVHDPHLGAALPADGSYYLKVRAWDHPGAGGEAYTYTLRLQRDDTDPTLTLDTPATNQIFATGPVVLQASASDSGSGLRSVAFYWHSGDWQYDPWELLLEDRDPSDGWGLDFDPELYPEQAGAAFLALASDWAGNQAFAGAWELTFDRSPPETELDPLSPTQGSTAFQVTWTAVDEPAGVAFFDLQRQIDAGTWTDWQTGVEPDVESMWFIGEPEKLYGFRVRGTDRAGNIEEFPPGAETSTYIQGCSAPDAWEPDDLRLEASVLVPDQDLQHHNLCQLNDADWLRFEARAGEYYRLIAVPGHPSSALNLTLYAPDGTTVLATAASADFGDLVSLPWTAQDSGTHWVEIRHINGAVAGDAVTYQTWIQAGYRQYLAWINR